MIVRNTGYLKLDDVLTLENFSIYRTQKNTDVLVRNAFDDKLYLCLPKFDRLPWKTVEGKKICNGLTKIFDSKKNSKDDIDTSTWNNGNQIMSYEEFVQEH